MSNTTGVRHMANGTSDSSSLDFEKWSLALGLPLAYVFAVSVSSLCPLNKSCSALSFAYESLKNDRTWSISVNLTFFLPPPAPPSTFFNIGLYSFFFFNLYKGFNSPLPAGELRSVLFVSTNEPEFLKTTEHGPMYFGSAPSMTGLRAFIRTLSSDGLLLTSTVMTVLAGLAVVSRRGFFRGDESADIRSNPVFFERLAIFFDSFRSLSILGFFESGSSVFLSSNIDRFAGFFSDSTTFFFFSSPSSLLLSSFPGVFGFSLLSRFGLSFMLDFLESGFFFSSFRFSEKELLGLDDCFSRKLRIFL
eukprot:comp16167_c1_seq1/m.13780 comp16167_c1_seq1/g.13780  ORF comp16167_c1_seq1/g.13780 comp16167_c1_seq1/m.13780 type:complete len:305 (+) comp16167_c1_seq1:126-1040(+)